MNKKIKRTPLMEQYETIRQQYPDMLLFFQVGDFYELFFEDAQKAAAFLGIALTKRGNHNGEPIALCGVPVHALDHYLHKLVRGGFCVAICSQLEPPRPGALVKRGVTQVLTPGTLTDTKLLDEKSASYLCSFFETDGKWGLLFSELLTAQLYATVIPAGEHKKLEAELNRFFPDEILLSDTQSAAAYQKYFKGQGYFTSRVHCQEGMFGWAQETLNKSSVQKIEQQKALGSALDLLYNYVKRNNEAALQAFTSIYFYQPDDFLVLDGATQRNLELLKNNQDGGRANTLLQTLDKTVTAMGARTLKKWLVRPLLSKTMIERRFEVVAFLKQNFTVTQNLQKQLQEVGDGERIIGRVALHRGQLHDYVHLLRILQTLPNLKKSLETETPALLTMLGHAVVDGTQLYTYLTQALNTDSQYEWKIKTGFNQKLDHLREMVHNSQAALLALEKQEQQATGINSLKIRFNSVHGYYIEVTNPNAHLVPERYKRRQTLVNRERYTCPELQQLENDITTARNQIEAVEQELFEQVKQTVVPHIHDLRKTMHALAQTDALLSFAVCAYERGYVKPELNDCRDIVIVNGKHPVIEQKLGSGFVANDTQLTDEQSLWIVTGPNMGGKSTYLRQVALLCLMAQCGCFVPAQSAQVPLLDRIFTRIGASDNVAEGKSTFLVEMEETAHICNYATEKSLVILDEVGRGTSTFDGVAIAQAVIEYIYTTIKARCLFATHYHELPKLHEQFPGIVSFYAASTQTKEGIVFLHKMICGVADGSFGLEVAKLAHLPEVVIQRAFQVEQELADSKTVQPAVRDTSVQVEQLQQELKRVQQKLNELASLDYDSLSPKKAFDILWQLKEG